MDFSQYHNRKKIRSKKGLECFKNKFSLLLGNAIFENNSLIDPQYISPKKSASLVEFPTCCSVLTLKRSKYNTAERVTPLSPFSLTSTSSKTTLYVSSYGMVFFLDNKNRSSKSAKNGWEEDVKYLKMDQFGQMRVSDE